MSEAVQTQGSVLTQGTPAPAAAAAPVQAAPAANDWKSSLPEDLRGDPNLSVIKDISGLAKSYIHAQKMIGKDKLVLPGKDATDDDWKGFFGKLAPEAPEKYELKAPEVIEKTSGDFLEKFKKAAHEVGLHSRQAQKLLEWYGAETEQSLSSIQEKQKATVEQGINSLKEEWGQKFDSNLQAARVALKEFGDPSLIEVLDKTGLGNEPAVIKAFAKIGANLAEDKIESEAKRQLADTPDEMQAKINSIMSDPQSGYWDKMHPKHQMAVAEVTKLNQLLYPESTA